MSGYVTKPGLDARYYKRKRVLVQVILFALMVMLVLLDSAIA